MSRRLGTITVATLLCTGEVLADSPTLEPAYTGPISTTAPKAPADMSDQGIGAEVGFATGGGTTPGGLRIAGHYFYQLSEADWFDGIAGFTFGGNDAKCFRDRSNEFVCNHGVADGNSIDVAASVRHFLARAQSGFWPYLRGGVGIGIARFRTDDVTGLAIPILAGAGVRVSMTPDLALTGEAQINVGFAAFNRGLGLEPQLGAKVTVGAEFRL